MRIEGARARLNATFRYVLLPGPDMKNLAILPANIVSITDPEHGLDRFRCIVQASKPNPDWSLSVTLIEITQGFMARFLGIASS